MKRHYCTVRQLRVEHLETRQLLAGDMTASVVNGDLFIVGDSEDNRLIITATANVGEFVLTRGDSDTTINSGAVPVTVSGVTGNVSIQLGDGFDMLQFDTDPAAISFAGEVSIDMGSNVEPLGLYNDIHASGANNLSIGGSLLVNGGYRVNGIRFENTIVTGDFGATLNGDFGQVEIKGGSIGGSLTVTATGGDKSVTISTVVNGDVHLNLDGAGDIISLTDGLGTPFHIGGCVYADLDSDMLDLRSSVVAAGNVVVEGDFVITGRGSIGLFKASVFGHLVATLDGESHFNSAGLVTDGNGVPVATTFNQIGGNLVINLTGESSSVGLNYMNAANDLVVRSGGGADDVRLNNVRAGNSLLVDTGAGNDIVWVHNSSADGEAAILAGGGNDYIRLGNVLFARSLYIDADSGFDHVSVSYASAIYNVTVSLGGDSDQATVSATSARGMALNAGSGYDAVRIETSATDYLFAALADGDDSLVIQSSLIRASALIDGGPGYDLFSSRGNLFGGLAQQNIEQIGS
jgi:hypothetical protein